MQPFGRNRYGPKIGGAVPLWGGELGLHLTEAYLHAKFDLDASNRLATVQQRHRHDIQHRANRFKNGRPKMVRICYRIVV